MEDSMLVLLTLVACAPVVGEWLALDASTVPFDSRCPTCETCIRLDEDGWVGSMAYEPDEGRWFAGAPGEWGRAPQGEALEVSLSREAGWRSDQEWSILHGSVTVQEGSLTLADDAQFIPCELVW